MVNESSSNLHIKNEVNEFAEQVDRLKNSKKKVLNEKLNVGNLNTRYTKNKQIITERERLVKNATELAEKILSKLSDEERQILIEGVIVGNTYKHLDIDTLDKLEKLKNSLNTLFIGIIPKMKELPFDKDHKMPEVIEDYLNPKLAELRAKKKANPQADTIENRLERKFEKFQLAGKMGIGVVSADAGQTGTLTLTDVNGKKVGIAKFSRKYAPLRVRFINIIKSFIGQLSYLSKNPFGQSYAEAAAFDVSKTLGFHVLPPSAEKNINKRAAVFQVYITNEKPTDKAAKNTQENIQQANNNGIALNGNVAENVLAAEKNIKAQTTGISKYIRADNKDEKISEVLNKTSFTESEKTVFQKFIIHDYLIGNLDCHEENWFVILSGSKADAPADREIVHIKGIDKANSFPRKQPAKKARAAHNQYKWKEFNIANQKFTPEVVEFVKESLSKEKIVDLARKLEEQYSDFFDAAISARFVLRAKVIRGLVNSDHSPRDLANCSTKKDMEEIAFSTPTK